MNRVIVLGLVASAGGCNLESGTLGSERREHTAEPPTASETVTSGTASSDPHSCADMSGLSRRDEVCRRWRCEHEVNRAAEWRGDPATCSAGDLDTNAGDRAVRLINVHRLLAGVAPVRAAPSWSKAAQECALLAHANAKLSHSPAHDWRCWSELGALTSSLSLIANRSVPLAISAFMEDPGNEATMVHRRWLLSEGLSQVGLGSTDRYACVIVDGAGLASASPPLAAAPDARRGWVAWPPSGPVPIDVFTAERLDTIGWTVQSDDDDLTAASVTVTEDGEPVAVSLTRLEPLLGSRSAVRFVPKGWKTKAGRTYGVSLRGARSIDFTVEPLLCP